MAVSRRISHSSFAIDSPLALRDGEVQLWRVDLEAIRSDESRWQKILSADEKERAARFHFPTDRQNFAAGRALLRIILGGYLAVDPNELSFAYAKNDKPLLAAAFTKSGITFNVSHSGGIALYAFARERELGIDIELVKRDVDVEAIARRFFSAHEQEQLAGVPPSAKVEAFFRCWTRKEAYIKATGDGLSLPLSQFDVSITPADNDALLATRPDASEAQRWQLRDVAAGTDYIAAVCVRGRDWILNSWNS